MSPNFRRRLLWLIGGRAAVVTLLLGSAILIQIQAPGSLPIDPFFFLIGLTYALTVVYVLLLRHAEQHRWLVDVQLACDAVIVSALVLPHGRRLELLHVALHPADHRREHDPVAADRHDGGRPELGDVRRARERAVLRHAGAPGRRRRRFAAPGAGGALHRLPEHLRVPGHRAAERLAGRSASAGPGRALEKTSNQLADLQAFSDHVISSLTGGLATTDIEGRILSFNKAAEGITGVTAAQVVERRATDVLQLPSEFAEIFGSREGRPRLPRVEYVFRCADGREIELGISTAILRTPRGEVGFVFTFQDVTEARRHEREARDSAAPGRRRRDGRRHRARDPQSAGVDVRLAADPARRSCRSATSSRS